MVKRGGRVAMLNLSDAMTDDAVAAFINEHLLTGFDAESLQSWLHAAEGSRRFPEEYMHRR